MHNVHKGPHSFSPLSEKAIVQSITHEQTWSVPYFFLMSRKPEKSSTAWTTGERTNLYSTQKPWSGRYFPWFLEPWQIFISHFKAFATPIAFRLVLTTTFSHAKRRYSSPSTLIWLMVRMAHSLAIVSCPPVTSKAWHWHHFNAFYTYSSVSFAYPIKLYGKYFFMSAVIAKRTRVPPIIN